LSIEAELAQLQSYSQELDLNLSKPEDRFKWFLASVLFAKRISAETAKKTYRRFNEEGLTTPEKIIEAGWDNLVRVLDSGGYVRYDFSTASNLIAIMKQLKAEYGDLETLHRESKDSKDLENRLRSFSGIGPVGVNIFLRELRGIWKKADPEPSRRAVEVGQRLGLKNPKRYEAALVRLSLEYCRKGRCEICPTRNYCAKRVI
jgi:endonuclease III